MGLSVDTYCYLFHVFSSALKYRFFNRSIQPRGPLLDISLHQVAYNTRSSALRIQSLIWLDRLGLLLLLLINELYNERIHNIM